jgi:hypothetical protein
VNPPPLNYHRPTPPAPDAPTRRAAITHCVIFGLLTFPTIALAAFATVTTVTGKLTDRSALTFTFMWAVILVLWAVSAALLRFTWCYFRAITHRPNATP